MTRPVRTAITTVRAQIDRVLEEVSPLMERLIAVGSIQCAIVIAAQAFMAVFPLLIGVIAYAPPRAGATISMFLRDRLGLGGDATDQVARLVATRTQLQSGLSIFGLILVLTSATSFTRALQRLYERAWQLPKGGARGSARGLVWLIGLIIYLGLLAIGFQLTTSHATGVSVLRAILGIVAAVALWWMTPFLLLSGRVRWRSLALTGILGGVAMVLVGTVSTIVMPRIVSNNEKTYGVIGAVFTIQSWLVVVACVIIGAAVLGAVATESEGRIGTWARGSRDLDSWQRVPHMLFRRDRARKSTVAEPEPEPEPEPATPRDPPDG